MFNKVQKGDQGVFIFLNADLDELASETQNDTLEMTGPAIIAAQWFKAFCMPSVLEDIEEYDLYSNSPVGVIVGSPYITVLGTNGTSLTYYFDYDEWDMGIALPSSVPGKLGALLQDRTKAAELFNQFMADDNYQAFNEIYTSLEELREHEMSEIAAQAYGTCAEVVNLAEGGTGTTIVGAKTWEEIQGGIRYRLNDVQFVDASGNKVDSVEIPEELNYLWFRNRLVSF